jgi:hypothetical protein
MTTINTVSVETPHGFRTFELHHADILAMPADLVVISTHPRLGDPPTGKILRALHDRFQFVVEAMPIWIRFEEGICACRQEGNASVPFRHLLTMRIAENRKQSDPQEFYDRAIRATFASVAALEFLGHPLSTIALPVLSGQRIIGYDAAVRSLLRYAFLWLRKSSSTELIRYFVHDAEQLQAWDDAMNVCLGRTYLTAGNESVVTGLRQEIVARIDAGALASAPGELAESLRRALADPRGLSVQMIAAVGRRTAEWVTEEMCRSLAIPIHRELVNNIEAVRKSRATADWIVSYLHSLRVFGNEAIHALAAKQGVIPVPAQLSSEDLASILCAIRVVLSFWNAWTNNRNIVSESS